MRMADRGIEAYHAQHVLLPRYQAFLCTPVPPVERGGVSQLDDGRRHRSSSRVAVVVPSVDLPPPPPHPPHLLSPYPPVVAVAVAVSAFADDQDGVVFPPRCLAAATLMEQLSDAERSSLEPQ